MPEDMYDSPDYFDAATDGPFGDDLAGYEDEYADYQDSWYDSLDENYGEATDSQDEYADSTSQDGEDQSDSSDNSDTEQTDTSEEGDTGGYQSLVGQLIGGLSGGSVSEDDGTDSSTDNQDGTNEDDSTESNETEVAEVSPFDVPDYIQFAQADLPLQAQADDLFQVTPSGTESFNTETVSSSTATQPTASDDSAAAPLTADLNQTVVVQQDWNSDTDWTVHQSRTNTFQQDSVNGDQDEVVPERTGTETYSITVINGTTTVETHSITSSIRLAEGTIPGEEAGEDGDDSYAIPDSWVTESSAPVARSSDSDSADGDSGDGSSSDSSSTDDTPDTASESGSFTSYNTGLTTTTTTTQIVLDDGTAAIQQTITMSWYAGFTWRTGGDIGNDLLGDDASIDVPEGTTVDVSGSFKVFASASIGGHFSVTTVRAVSDNPILADEGFISAGFAVTAMAGGSMTFTTEIGRDESSGSVADGTDTIDFAKLKDTQSSAGRVGVSFWIAGSTADDEASTSDDSESQSESIQDSVQPDTDDAPKVGQQSAEEMLSENKSGVQLNFEIEGSSGSSKDHTIESKIRHDEYDTETFSHTDISSSDNNMSFAFAAGTEEISISVGAGGSSSTNIVTSYENRSTGNNGENTSEGVDDETLIVFDKDDYTRVTSSEWSFLFSLGTGEGFQLENTSSFDVSVSSVQDQGDIFNGDKAGYRWEHTYIDYSEDKEPEDPDGPLPERKNLKTAVFYDSTGISEAETPINGKLSGLDGAPSYDDGTKTPEQILADYRAHREQQLRLEALLAITDDPEMQRMLRDQIVMQERILSDITAAASTAGITTGQLTDIDNAAQAAVDEDPPGPLQEWDGGESWIDNFIGGGIIGGLQGGAAAIDGAIPIWDPFEGIAYDGDDTDLQWSQFFGGVARNSLLGAWGTSVWLARGGGQFSAILTSGTSRIGSLPLPHVSFAFGSSRTGMMLAEGMGSGHGIYTLPWATLALGEGTTYYGAVTGIPILYPTAVAAFAAGGNTAHNCLSAAWRAYLHGLGKGW